MYGYDERGGEQNANQNTFNLVKGQTTHQKVPLLQSSTYPPFTLVTLGERESPLLQCSQCSRSNLLIHDCRRYIALLIRRIGFILYLVGCHNIRREAPDGTADAVYAEVAGSACSLNT